MLFIALPMKYAVGYNQLKALILRQEDPDHTFKTPSSPHTHTLIMALQNQSIIVSNGIFHRQCYKKIWSLLKWI